MMRILKSIPAKSFLFIFIFLSSCTRHPIDDTVSAVLFTAGIPLMIAQEIFFKNYETDFSDCHPELIGRKFRVLMDLPAYKCFPGRIIKNGTYRVFARNFQIDQNETANVRCIPTGTEFKIIKVIASGRGSKSGPRMCDDSIIALITENGNVEEICVEQLFKEEYIDFEPSRKFEPLSTFIEEI